MRTHLIAPPELIPLISARLLTSPPVGLYCLHPFSQFQGKFDPSDLVIAIQLQNMAQVLDLHQSAPQLVDAILWPSPFAPTHGFVTLASGSQQHLNFASDMLDALSPGHNAWLHAGNLGACGFLYQLWLALISPQGTPPFFNWQIDTQCTSSDNIHPLQLNQSDLLAQLASLIAQQQLQTQTLASLSRRYLAESSTQSAFTAHHPQASNLFASITPACVNTIDSPARQIAQLFAIY